MDVVIKINMDGVAKTSLLTAALRAAESKRAEGEGRLFLDPYAELLAGADGAVLMQKGIEAAGDQPAIAIRTFYFDTKIKAALNEGILQIIMLAAGMDTRAYRLTFPVGTRVFELDQKEVFDYKHEKLKNLKPNCERKTLGLDLRDEWQDQLIQAGFKTNERTLWLVEGLLMYLEESQVVTLFDRINSLASSKDIMLFDILSRSLLEAPYMLNQLNFLKSIGAPWRFGTNEPEEFMKKYGWNAVVTQTGEFAPHRWPFPVAPRHVPNVPRGFLVEAQKI